IEEMLPEIRFARRQRRPIDRSGPRAGELAEIRVEQPSVHSGAILLDLSQIVALKVMKPHRAIAFFSVDEEQRLAGEAPKQLSSVALIHAGAGPQPDDDRSRNDRILRKNREVAVAVDLLLRERAHARVENLEDASIRVVEVREVTFPERPQD